MMVKRIILFGTLNTTFSIKRPLLVERELCGFGITPPPPLSSKMTTLATTLATLTTLTTTRVSSSASRQKKQTTTFSSSCCPRATAIGHHHHHHHHHHHRGGGDVQQNQSSSVAVERRRRRRRRSLIVTTVLAAGGSQSSSSSSSPTSAKAAKSDDEWKKLGNVCAVLGSQWGDEGKGKLVDILAREYEVVCRCQGGANAGHTIYDDDGKKYALHLVPSGILNEKALCVVGNGVVVHLPGMFEELDALEKVGVDCAGRMIVSDRAHLLFELHKEVDGLREAELSGDKIGTTKRGIGPAYASKATRNGIRVGDIKNMDTFAEKLKTLAADAGKRFEGFEYDVDAEIQRYGKIRERILPFIADTVEIVNQAHADKKKILVEGANATMLDLDFGTYPFVTSSNPSLGGVCSGLGLAPNKFETVIGVAKAYTTRVGSGPYPTELFGDLADDLRAIGYEYGTTTGRPRRIGWLDMVALNFASKINGFTHLNITKLDCLSELDEIKIGVAYKLPDGTTTTAFPASIEELEKVEVVYETLPGWKSDIFGVRDWNDMPENAKNYVKRVEELSGGVECRFIGVGPGRDAIVIKP